MAATAKISGGAECALRWRRIAAVAALGRAEWDPPVPATCTTTATECRVLLRLYGWACHSGPVDNARSRWCILMGERSAARPRVAPAV